MIKGIKKTKAGISLIETLFYVAFLAVLSVVSINSIITMSRSFRETTLHRELVQSSDIMEKISREIRGAADISTIASGNLELSGTDENGANRTAEFLLASNNLQYLENGSLVGNLNTTDIRINTATFTQINTSEGKAVKITLNLTSYNDTATRTYNFYDTVVLRGNY